MPTAQLELIFELSVLAGVVVVANLAEKRPFLRPVLYFSLGALNLLFVITFIGLMASSETVGEADKVPILVLTVVFGLAATAALFEPVRRRLAVLFPRPEITGEGFNPQSMVHMTALVFCVYFLGDRILEFAVAGGMTGLAQDFTAPSAGSLWAQMGIFVVFAVLGVGLGIRRPLSGAIRRLGLRAPTIVELGVAAGMAFLLFVAVFMISNIWEALTPQDVIREQTQVSELLSNSINTLSMGLLIAGTAAFSEEIAFRGALQPVFGLWPTTVFFSLVHIQYTLTPATLIIVLVGLGLGWLRQRYNTTTSIVAHFLYDFGLIALSLYGRVLFNMVGGSQ